MNKKLYTRWWFWVGALVLAIAAWYVKGYVEWRADMAPYIEYSKTAQEYWQTLEKQSADWEKKYKEDTYGGDTPEETLALYVAALEAGDLELAAKYYIPEEQEDHLTELNESSQNDNIAFFIEALKLESSISFDDESKVSAVRFYKDGNPYNIEFLQFNPYTQKWKLFSNK